MSQGNRKQIKLSEIVHLTRSKPPRRGADAGSDHNLVLATIKLKLCGVVRTKGMREKYDVNKLRNPEIRKEFVLELRNRFSCLTEEEIEDEALDNGDYDSIERCWNNVKTAYSATAKKVLGYRKRKSKTWISMDSWKEIEERRKLKKKINDAKSERLRKRWQEEYRKKDKLVKRSLRRDKREWANDIAKEAEGAAAVGNMKGVYDATRKLCNDRPKNITMVKDKEGRLLTKDDEIRKRWRDHFTEVLNRPVPSDEAIIVQDASTIETIETGYITREEIRRAVGNMKNGKAAGIDSINVEMLKADTDTTTNVLHELFQKIWDQEEIPDDWSRSLIVKLPKKGDLTVCGNWRGITLMSTAAKVMGRVIVTRIREGINQLLRDEQAGYRSGRSTTEQIFVLRNIIEQVIEWNACLYVCFVDFEKAFDSVHRETLWRLLASYGIPTKLVDMVKTMYKNCRCAVLDETGHLEWFEVLSGVKQGCVMSGFLFLIVIDWVMTRTVDNSRNGIRWKLTTTLDDLDFADDLALLSSRWSQAQDKLNRLNEFGGKVGLKINIDKTKVLRYNPGRLDPLMIREREVEDVESFVYLGAKVDKQGGTASDIRARIGTARAAFNKLNKVWNSSLLSQSTKTTIFKTNVVSVLLYGCETWRMTKGDEHKLNVFQHKCLRKILKVYWPMKISNEEIRERSGTRTIDEQVRTRRWKWLGHVLRMPSDKNPKIALTWAPEGRRRKGRPRETWRRTVNKEREHLGFRTWRQAEVAARDKVAWRKRINGPILREERRER